MKGVSHLGCKYVTNYMLSFSNAFYIPRDNLLALRKFLTTESPLKIIKSLFYFMLKAIFIFKLFTFLAWLFGHVGKWVDKKGKVNFKFMTSYTGKQIIEINILPNISRSKGNLAIKFGQLIDYNVRNIFLQISCRKLGRKTSSIPLSVF